MFYHYRQNNSGGSFYYASEAGITVNVIVEAETPEDANKRALEIGIYFDGCETGYDCECCGDRWNRYYGTPDSVPSIYGQDVSSGIYLEQYGSAGEGKPEGYIHYLDGAIKPVTLSKSQYGTKVVVAMAVPKTMKKKKKSKSKPKTLDDLYRS